MIETIKYHLLNILSVTLFAYLTAITVNQFITYSLSGIESPSGGHASQISTHRISGVSRSFNHYIPVIESGFFQVAEDVTGKDFTAVSEEPENLSLIGTITGPSSIARAVIQLKSEQRPRIFRPWSDVYGYTLTKITQTRVHLRKGDRFAVLDMYKPGENDTVTGKSYDEIKSYDKNISRSELKQNINKNITRIFRGLHASPHVIDGVAKGYKIHTLRSGNPLYKMGLRQGDIIKKVNERPINTSSEFVTNLQRLRTDAILKVEIERNGSLLQVDVNFSD